MKVRPTKADASGTGYYQGSDGEFYYGNPKNGYLNETRETARRRAARENAGGQKKSTNYTLNKLGSIPSSFEKKVERGILGGLYTWDVIIEKALLCLYSDGFFSMLRNFGYIPAYLILTIKSIKKTIIQRAVPWGRLLV